MKFKKLDEVKLTDAFNDPLVYIVVEYIKNSKGLLRLSPKSGGMTCTCHKNNIVKV